MRELPGSLSAVFDPQFQSPALAVWRRALLAEGAGSGSGSSSPTLYIIISVILVVFSGLMSGLTLGLLSLSSVEVEVLRRSGTDREKRLATKIMPVLKRPHLLLVTLLMCNAAALEALPLFVNKFVSEVVSIIISVTAVLLCGEIIPQAVCSKHGLEIGAATAWLVRGLMLICSPIAWPLSKVLDYFLGRHQTALFRREHLKTLVDLHGTDGLGGGYLTPDEINVIRGALDLQIKTARHVLTPLSKVFMLPSDTLLDEATLKRILQSGFSRFLVHAPGDVQRIQGLVLCKELMLIDADDKVCIGALKLRAVPCMAASTPLYDLLHAFKNDHTHMVVLTKPAAASCSVCADGQDHSSNGGKRKTDSVVVEVGANSAAQVAAKNGKQVPEPEPAIVPVRLEPQSSGPITPLEEAAAVGDAIGIITLEDVIEELLDAEDDDDKSVRQPSTHHHRPDSPHAHAALPPRLQKVLGSFQTLPGDVAANVAKSGQSPAVQPPMQSQQPQAPVVAAAASSVTLNLQRAPSIKALPP